ncbi:hypothetical protein AMTR_s00036p00211410 [Amborella trichopoda]|uniref:Uncharacterized protein n=1 Tax=Amborella trichopoda TaxID=13333 RepID=U5D4Y4_AMBTC|nr:hypothetical protein AMTR_s00036p00211410 [Amborella trichopoda]
MATYTAKAWPDRRAATLPETPILLPISPLRPANRHNVLNLSLQNLLLYDIPVLTHAVLHRSQSVEQGGVVVEGILESAEKTISVSTAEILVDHRDETWLHGMQQAVKAAHLWLFVRCTASKESGPLLPLHYDEVDNMNSRRLRNCLNNGLVSREVREVHQWQNLIVGLECIQEPLRGGRARAHPCVNAKPQAHEARLLSICKACLVSSWFGIYSPLRSHALKPFSHRLLNAFQASNAILHSFGCQLSSAFVCFLVSSFTLFQHLHRASLPDEDSDKLGWVVALGLDARFRQTWLNSS